MPPINVQLKRPVKAGKSGIVLGIMAEHSKDAVLLNQLDDEAFLQILVTNYGAADLAQLAKKLLVISTASGRAASLLRDNKGALFKRYATKSSHHASKRQAAEGQPSKGLLRDARKRAKVVRENLVAQRQVVSSSEMTDALSITRQALSKAVQANRIFFVELGGERYYPAFFSDPLLERRQVEHISKALGDLAGWEKWRFFTTPKGSLGRITPLAALRKGLYKEVLKSATGFAER